MVKIYLNFKLTSNNKNIIKYKKRAMCILLNCLCLRGIVVLHFHFHLVLGILSFLISCLTHSSFNNELGFIKHQFVLYFL